MTHMQLLIQNILEHPHDFKWQTQGLGMMRLYLSQAVRLHIWDSSLKVPGVSALHTHPWHMKSTVIFGRYKQHRYTPIENNIWLPQAEEFNCVTIRCGEKACVTAEPIKIRLLENPEEIYLPLQSYEQAAPEIHLSIPDDGTVTLVERTFLEDPDHAQVFWRGRGGWVDAAPRPATREEVETVTRRVLETWL